MICKLCKTNETNNKCGICDKCGIEIQLSVHYYIGGKEVTKEEHDKFINGE